jgi:hypothetical protein
VAVDDERGGREGFKNDGEPREKPPEKYFLRRKNALGPLYLGVPFERPLL